MPAIENPLITHNLKKHVTTLSEEIGPRHINKPHALHKAANYISHEWEAMGYKVEPQVFSAMGVRCINLIVEHPGTHEDAATIVITANYDTVKDCPGANNNATGIASLLEISRLLKEIAPKHPLRFMALTNENPPFIGSDKMGSWVYAHRAQQQRDNIKTTIILDSLGYYNFSANSQLYPPFMGMFYPNRANFLAMVSGLAAAPSMLKFNSLFKTHCHFSCKKIITANILPGKKWNDDSSFSIHGYKTFTVTDTSPYRYPFYQTGRDTAEKIDYQSLHDITIGLAKALIDFSRA